MWQARLTSGPVSFLSAYYRKNKYGYQVKEDTCAVLDEQVVYKLISSDCGNKMREEG